MRKADITLDCPPTIIKINSEYPIQPFWNAFLHFSKDEQIQNDCNEFLWKYSKLKKKHMSIPPDTNNTNSGFYLSHHEAIKHESITTNIRVVFDRFAKTFTGTSLNDALMVAPKIQEDPYSILFRFRSRWYTWISSSSCVSTLYAVSKIFISWIFSVSVNNRYRW